MKTVIDNHTWNAGAELYVFCSGNEVYSKNSAAPKVYTRGPAKSKFTRGFKYTDTPLQPATYERLLKGYIIDNVYKLVSGVWVVIFDVRSDACRAWAEGRIDQRELRDLIDW